MGLAADDRFLQLADVVRLTAYKKTTIYGMMDAGQFPQRHRIGRNRVVWLESAVREWMDERLKAAA